MGGSALNFSYSGRHPVVMLRSGPPAVGLCHWTPHSLGFSISSPSKSGFKLFFCSISTCQEYKLERNIRRNIRKTSQQINKPKEKSSLGSLRVLVIWLMFWALVTPSYWPCVYYGSVFAHALCLVWNSSPSQSTWKILILCLTQLLKGHLFCEAILDSPGRVRRSSVYIPTTPCTRYTTDFVGQGRPLFTTVPL